MEVNKWKEMEGNIWKDNINMEEVELILNKAKELEIKEEIENFIIYIQNIIKELNNYYFPNKPNPAIYTILNNSLNILNMKIKNKSQSKFKFKSNSNTVSDTVLGPTETTAPKGTEVTINIGTNTKDITTKSTTTMDTNIEDTTTTNTTAVGPDTVTEELNEVKIFNENYIIKNIQNQKIIKVLENDKIGSIHLENIEGSKIILLNVSDSCFLYNINNSILWYLHYGAWSHDHQ